MSPPSNSYRANAPTDLRAEYERWRQLIDTPRMIQHFAGDLEERIAFHRTLLDIRELREVRP